MSFELFVMGMILPPAMIVPDAFKLPVTVRPEPTELDALD